MENINEKDLIDQAKQAQPKKEAKPEQATPEEGKEEQAEAKPQDEQKPEETLEDKPLEEVLGEKKEEDPEPQEDDTDEDEDEGEEMIPKATFLRVKKSFKDEIRKLKEGSKSVSDSDIEDVANDVADKYNLDPDFMKDLIAKSTGVVEKRYQSRIAELEKQHESREKENKKKELFDKVFNQIIEKNPNLKGVVNKDFVMKEALNPENSKKTVKGIINDIYGGVINQDTPSFDGYSPHREAPEPENLLNPSSEDMKLINKDPKLKKKHIDNVIKNVRW